MDTVEKITSIPKKGILKLRKQDSDECKFYISFEDRKLHYKDGKSVENISFTENELFILYFLGHDHPAEFYTSEEIGTAAYIDSVRWSMMNIRKKFREVVELDLNNFIQSNRRGYRFISTNAWSCSNNLDDTEEWESRANWAKKRWETPPLYEPKITKFCKTHKENITENKLKTIIYLISHLRQTDGSLTKRELTDGLGQGNENILDEINHQLLCLKVLEEEKSGTDNPRFDKIVSSKKYRFILDLILDEFVNDGETHFNPHLYYEDIKESASQDSTMRNKVFSMDNSYTSILDDLISRLNNNSWQHNLYEIIRANLNNYSKNYRKPVIDRDYPQYKNCYFDQDAINELVSKIRYEDKSGIGISGLDLSGSIFDGDVQISGVRFVDSIDFSRALFRGDFCIDGCEWTAHHESSVKINFREAVFEARVHFIGSNLSLISNKTAINETVVTFEDALFAGKGEAQEFALQSSDFRGVKLDFYESLFNEYRVEISDCRLDNSLINMNNSIMANELEIVGNDSLCNVNLNFAKGNRLMMANCFLNGVLSVSNIAQFELLNVTIVSGLVLSDSTWDFEKNKDSVNTRNANRYLDETLYQADDHPLLKACVNKDDIAKQFLILKECFRRSGDAISEQQANRLYVTCSSVNSNTTNAIEAVYGISILQATKSDYQLISRLVAKCKPLDKHTMYTYWTLLRYCCDTCFIAYKDSIPVGLITGFCKENTGFIWQIGVCPDYRREGIALLLINAMVKKLKSEGASRIETTITDDNLASLSTFVSYCQSKGILFKKVKDSEQYENEIIYEMFLPQ